MLIDWDGGGDWLYSMLDGGSLALKVFVLIFDLVVTFSPIGMRHSPTSGRRHPLKKFPLVFLFVCLLRRRYYLFPCQIL